MDFNLENRRESCSLSSSSSSLSLSSASSSYASEERVDRQVKMEEIEAAETLAQLAMPETHSADKWCSNRVTHESPTSHPAGQAVAGQNPDDKISTTTSVETERNQQDDGSRHLKVEQDADLPKNTSCTSGRSSKSRRNLTEEEKEARRIRRILANRESARQTIRRRQALCEELSRKAATLVLENENLKREKEQALKEYQSLETTNKHLKEQIAKSINTETEKAPVVPETSVAEVTPLSGNNPWFLYKHVPATQLVWHPILPARNPVQLQTTPFHSILVPSNAHGPYSSEAESCYKQYNLINDDQTQNPLYMFPCPWLFPLPETGNGQSPSSSALKDKDKLPLGEQCSPSLSLNTVENVDCPTALSLRLETEPSAWTEARPMNDLGHTSLRFSLDEGDQETGYHIIENSHASKLGVNGHDSAVKQEHEFHLHSASNCKVSSTAAYITTSFLEKKQEQFICLGKNPVDAVAAAEARKRRKELTKLKSIQNRQSRMHC